MLADVKIEQDKENPYVYRVYKNGQEISRINHIDFSIDVDSVPEVNIGIVGGCDFEGMADIKFDYSPHTIRESCKIIRDELLKHEELYHAFLLSIKSAIDEAPNYMQTYDLSDQILKRIIGEE